MYLDVEQQSEEFWPGMLAFHRQEGYAGSVVYPLVFGSPQRRLPRSCVSAARRTMSSTASCWWRWPSRRHSPSQLTRLAYQAKEAAVLVERARIGQEIHDGLAQAFTGILMQLGGGRGVPVLQEEELGAGADR